MAGRDEPGFDSAKAEMFEAVGHPFRIKIIEALDEGGLGFAELKKRVGIESSGHLAFHLGKLHHLVVMDGQGQYVLTGEGREALNMIQTVSDGGAANRKWGRIPTWKMVAAMLLILLVALAVVATVELLQIGRLSQRPPNTIELNGKDYWYVVIPLVGLPAEGNVSLLISCVNFTLYPSHLLTITLSQNLSSYNFSVTLRGSSSGNTTVYPITGIVYYSVDARDVSVRFLDGSVETMRVDQVTNSGNEISIIYTPSSFPWFSVHINPQVAISENATAVTLYVSTGL